VTGRPRSFNLLANLSMPTRTNVGLSDQYQEPPLAPTSTLANGSSLGRFVILGLVGRGAMGEVYAAYDPNLDRKIAIKLVGGNYESDGQANRGRLMREAQATARISHPNVVVVYEADTLDERVFIAMEFVDGHTLRYWLQAQRRTWLEIVDVFIAAGRGLAAAHDKDLVHRDFKPDNVMVANTGQVRVMDFGLARRGSTAMASLDADAGATLAGVSVPSGATPRDASTAVIDPEATQNLDASARSTAPGTPTALDKLTRTGTLMGTPAYMSPEQFRGRYADARSDQFSFCVALYEALYEARPFGGGSFAELAEHVVGGRLIDPPESDTIPSWLRAALKRGLSANPHDRFPSMNELLAELDRRPGAARTGFAGGAAARLDGIWTLEASDTGDEVALAPEKNEVHAAFVATGKAYAAATFDRTRAVLDRYVERWAALYVEACEATHVRGEQSTEVLDLRIECLLEGLRDVTALCRLFRSATAEVVENAVSAAMALPPPERCRNIELLRAVVRPPPDAETQAAVTALRTQIGDLRALLRVGRYRDGLEQCGRVVDEARQMGYGPTLAEVLLIQGSLHNDAGRADAAIESLDEAVWCAELARHDEVAAEAATYIVYTTGYLQARFDLAETWCRHTEMLLRRMGGHDDLWGWYLNNRAAMRKAQGSVAAAIDDARAAIVAKSRGFGPDSHDVGISLLNLSGYLVEAGSIAEGIEASRHAIEALTRGLGPEHPKTALALSNHGEWLYRTRRFPEALEFAQRALAIFERETDPNGPFVAHALWVIGAAACNLGAFDRALPALERARENREAANAVAAELGEVHLALGRTLFDGGVDRERGMALVLRARQEYQQAPRTTFVDVDLTELNRWLAARQ
jgi:serine/threonine protein kinase/tetratricopeptide (TPR) repeat protein